ncbi:MAG: hypothetical protein ACOC0B_00995 [bacterium]
MKQNKHDDVFSEWTLRGRPVRNRTVLAAITNKQSHDDGRLSETEQRWLSMRAEGGFGIVTTCAANVLPSGRAWDGEAGVYADRHIEPMRKLTDNLRSHGAVSLCQIFHGGYRCPQRLIGQQPVSASDVALDVPGFEPARAMSAGEVGECIEAFAAAASRCEQAGFDGVEIHGAHTFLITQFLSREINARTDEYGGSLAGRYRFLGEIIRACRARTGPEFVVGVRLSPGIPLPHAGISLEETVQILPWVANDGVDFVHLSLKEAWSEATQREGAGGARGGSAANRDSPGESNESPGKRGESGANRDSPGESNESLRERRRPDAGGETSPEKPSGSVAIGRAREALGSRVAIIACGGVFELEQARTVLRHGADAVAVARAGIGNYRWPTKLAEGEAVVRPPYEETHLVEQGLSAPFLEYMRGWPGFVKGGA